MNRFDSDLCPSRAKQKIKGAVSAAEADEGSIPELADFSLEKGALAMNYCKNIHAAIAFLRIVDGTKSGNGYRDGKVQPQLDFSPHWRSL